MCGLRVKLRDIPYIVRIITVHSNPGVVVHHRRQGLFGSQQPGGGQDLCNVDLHIIIAVIKTKLAKGKQLQNDPIKLRNQNRRTLISFLSNFSY